MRRSEHFCIFRNIESCKTQTSRELSAPTGTAPRTGIHEFSRCCPHQVQALSKASETFSREDLLIGPLEFRLTSACFDVAQQARRSRFGVK